MAYLGRGIENLSDRVVLDSLTASATASYTLQLNSVNFVPSSASSLTVSLNGVIQKPDSSYTVSGSTLTFSSALTSSDSIDFIIAERGITLQTPSAGSVGTSQLANLGITNDKIANSTIEVGKVASSLKNTPSFYAYRTTAQTFANGVATEIIYSTEDYDTANAYDTSTGRFTPQEAGKYFCSAWFRLNTGTNILNVECLLFKNGSAITANPFSSIFNDHINTSFISSIITLNGSSDYVSAFGAQYSGSSQDSFTNGNGFFAYKLIGV